MKEYKVDPISNSIATNIDGNFPPKKIVLFGVAYTRDDSLDPLENKPTVKDVLDKLELELATLAERVLSIEKLASMRVAKFDGALK